MCRIVILDDLQDEIDIISSTIKKHYPHIEIQSYTTIKDMENHIDPQYQSYIFILDIFLKNEDGISAGKVIENIFSKHLPPIIFISASIDVATEVYEVEHIYFIHKPQLEQKIDKAIQKAQNILEKSILKLELKNKKVIIFLQDIIYIERMSRYSYVHTQDEVIKTAMNMSDLLSQLSSDFVRSHTSYIINFNYVKEISRHEIILSNEISIPVSRPYIAKIKEKYQDFIVEKV